MRRRYRLLAIVLGLWLIAALWERRQTGDISPETAKRLSAKSNFEYLRSMADLYPKSARAYAVRAYQAMSVEGNPDEALRLIDEALANGGQSEEQLLYQRAKILYQRAKLLSRLEADKEEIERAVALWRWHFPGSSQLDPRSESEGNPEDTETDSLLDPRSENPGAAASPRF